MCCVFAFGNCGVKNSVADASAVSLLTLVPADAAASFTMSAADFSNNVIDASSITDASAEACAVVEPFS
ncbi:hypothetical protein [Pectinatus frisingensis]|uniref:hypothetical protein n=1 Tax=Pectinatus frisingensis TaxID=865 RepID=UPI003D803FB0